MLVKEQANGSVVMDKGPGIDLDLCGPLAFDTGVKAKLSTKGVEKPDIHMQKIQILTQTIYSSQKLTQNIFET